MSMQVATTACTGWRRSFMPSDEAGMPDDEPFRRAVREHVEFGSHVAQQNSRAETDAELHPIREVPHWDWSG
jgi:hemoglobin